MFSMSRKALAIEITAEERRVLEGVGAFGSQPLSKTTPLPLRPRAVVA